MINSFFLCPTTASDFVIIKYHLSTRETFPFLLLLTIPHLSITLYKHHQSKKANRDGDRPVCVCQTGLPETNLVYCLHVKSPVEWLWRYGGTLGGGWKTWKPCEESISGSSVGGSPLIWWYQCPRVGNMNRTNAIRQQHQKQDCYLCPWKWRSPKHRHTHIDTDTPTYTGI